MKTIQFDIHKMIPDGSEHKTNLSTVQINVKQRVREETYTNCMTVFFKNTRQTELKWYPFKDKLLWSNNKHCLLLSGQT